MRDRSVDQTEILQTVLICLLVSGLTLLASRSVRRRLERARSRQRAAAAIAGEQRGEAILRHAGYRIERRQVEGHWIAEVDGHPIHGSLRADYLVSRGGRRFVAEVKTGQGTSLQHASTRRQLREYRDAFDTDGLLLVDADAATVSTIVFAQPVQRPSRTGFLLLLCLSAGVAALLL
ncbi:MAG: hypothetical protein AAGF12_31135 [Myxococcota bacterium]